MQQQIKDLLNESIEVKKKVLETLVPKIEEASKLIFKAFKDGNKVLIFGNGGSAADSQHIAAEFINRFKINRNPLPAMALSTDTSIITSCGNDFGFELIFTRQVQALAKKGDILIGISTSGNSLNVLNAIETGKKIGTKSIGLLGCGGGRIAPVVDLNLTVPSDDTPRVQEAHITIAHIICELVEGEIFNGK
ncbi:MAG: D-sedoheptulose 7-phosphate isomerase [Candidatus Saganbacteria bacterium]|nr:D-sedoheptulose 7-phosphate isomerase [Candidatus Saganbacteria bacterium]